MPKELKVHQTAAAKALSVILQKHGIEHAIIGGFAVNLLGFQRTTHDVDVQIDVSNVMELRGRIVQLLTQEDPRFSLQHHKIWFTAADRIQMRVPVETLPIGELGLPQQMKIHRPGDGSVPILHPSVLVLTKIKRCVHFIGSSRPLSMSKFRTDIDDIKFLLEWLVKEGQHIDFDDYQAANVDRLYTATKDLVAYWRQKGKSDLVELMEAVLKPADRRKIM